MFQPQQANRPRLAALLSGLFLRLRSGIKGWISPGEARSGSFEGHYLAGLFKGGFSLKLIQHLQGFPSGPDGKSPHREFTDARCAEGTQILGRPLRTQTRVRTCLRFRKNGKTAHDDRDVWKLGFGTAGACCGGPATTQRGVLELLAQQATPECHGTARGRRTANRLQDGWACIQATNPGPRVASGGPVCERPLWLVAASRPPADAAVAGAPGQRKGRGPGRASQPALARRGRPGGAGGPGVE